MHSSKGCIQMRHCRKFIADTYRTAGFLKAHRDHSLPQDSHISDIIVSGDARYFNMTPLLDYTHSNPEFLVYDACIQMAENIGSALKLRWYVLNTLQDIFVTPDLRINFCNALTCVQYPPDSWRGVHDVAKQYRGFEEIMLGGAAVMVSGKPPA